MKQKDYSQQAIDYLKSKIIGSEQQDDALIIPYLDLTIKPITIKSDEREEGTLAVFNFATSHPSFTETIVDRYSQVGKTPEIAITKACQCFLLNTYSCICNYLSTDKKYFTTATTYFNGEKHWKVFAGATFVEGKLTNEKMFSFFKLIKPSITSHLGNHKIISVHLYASKSKDGVMACECRINNILCKELTNLISTKVIEWECETAFFSQKQFMIFAQNEDTYTPYPYSKQQIEEFTDKSLKLFEKCDTPEKFANLTTNIQKITNDRDLAIELRGFIPEMCAEFYFTKVKIDEKITIRRATNEIGKFNDIIIYKDLITPYYWIFNRVITNFLKNKNTKELYNKLIAMSSTYRTVKEVTEKSPEKKIDLTSLNIRISMFTPEDYTIR